MKRKLPILLIGVLTASALTFTALAEDTNYPKTDKPDNTSRNVRDRDNQEQTPIDQGNSKYDRDTTALIRKEIMAEKNMSVNAQNVKIITSEGRVTLRGPVDSENEKLRVGRIANRIAEAKNVDNQLEVKVTSNTNK